MQIGSCTGLIATSMSNNWPFFFFLFYNLELILAELTCSLVGMWVLGVKIDFS